MFLSSLASALEVAWEQERAIPAFLGTWRTTGNPLLALHAYAEETKGKMDDAIVLELEAGMRQGLKWLRTAAVALETASRVAGDVGYHAMGWRLVLTRWLEGAE